MSTPRLSKKEKKELKRKKIEEIFLERKKLKKFSKQEISRSQTNQNEFLSERSERKHMEREDYFARLSTAPTLLLDCDFFHLMNNQEKTSLKQQILQAHGATRKFPDKPVRLSLCGVCDDQLADLKTLPGMHCWGMEIVSQKLEEKYAKEKEYKKFFYLTADAEDELEIANISRNTVLVVGGIVDRNRHKGITRSKAEVLNMEIVKLPITKFIQLSSSQVLTVNQVIEILANAYALGNWKDALVSAFPERKIIRIKATS